MPCNGSVQLCILRAEISIVPIVSREQVEIFTQLDCLILIMHCAALVALHFTCREDLILEICVLVIIISTVFY